MTTGGNTPSAHLSIVHIQIRVKLFHGKLNGDCLEHILEAQVIDSRHLKLKKPIKLAPGSTVIFTIEPAEGVAEEQEWYLLSSQGLEEAYSENEPDYSLERIKIPNPEHQS